MKKIAFYTAITFISLTIMACSDKPPSIRVTNERSTKANVQIKTPGNTINQNDVAPGTTTNYQEIPEGKTDVTAVIQDESVSPTTTFNASNDNNYTVIILNSTPPALKVNVTSK